MLKTAWLSLDHLVRAAVGHPLCVRGYYFLKSIPALGPGAETEMAHRKALMRTTLFDPALGQASKNNFRALSKSGFAKRLRVYDNTYPQGEIP